MATAIDGTDARTGSGRSPARDRTGLIVVGSLATGLVVALVLVAVPPC